MRTTSRVERVRLLLMAERYKVELGRAIARRRKELGMTQSELANATHYKEAQTVSRWERGENLPADLEAVAEALECTLRDLVAGIEPPNGKAARYLGMQPVTGTPDLAEAFNGSGKSFDQRLTDIEGELRRLSGAVSELVAGMADLTSRVAAPSRGSRTGADRR